MTLQQIRYCLTIAETGSMNRSAEKLYVTQPALTGAIQELETELAITIFNRTNRGVTLTNEGRRFLHYARQIYQQYELMEQEQYRPGMIIGVPVGFVNVVQAKELILGTDVPSIIARGRKGGSNVAAAIVNALMYQLTRN